MQFKLNFYDEIDYKLQDFLKKNDEIQFIIYQTLIESIYEYPIRIYISSSLKFNYKIHDNPNLIETPSNRVNVFL